jgi:hypothetical protein
MSTGQTPRDAFSPDELREQIRHAVDPEGEQRRFLEAIDVTGADAWVQLLGRGAATQWSQLRALSRDYTRLLATMQDALQVLVPRGWAPFQMDSAATLAAIRLVGDGDPEAADQLLAGQWEGEGAWRTKRLCDRVRTMGSGARQRDLETLFQQRARLLLKAKDHHEAGRYDASIPILHAQMEAIVVDVTAGKKFFTKTAARADLTDPTNLVTVEACLPVLQTVFGGNVSVTQARGSLSRHGVAHGRELAYDTRENSAKCWSVLDAIVEWARPLGHAVAERRLAEQQAARAGSDDVDELGRRIDDRQFRETRDVLKLLGSSAIGHRRNSGRFRPDLINGVYTSADFTKRGLPRHHGIHMVISNTGDVAWFWRRTITGWVLAYAVGENKRGMVEWFYAGVDEPAGPPAAESGWSEPFIRPPDWA